MTSFCHDSAEMSGAPAAEPEHTSKEAEQEDVRDRANRVTMLSILSPFAAHPNRHDSDQRSVCLSATRSSRMRTAPMLPDLLSLLVPNAGHMEPEWTVNQFGFRRHALAKSSGAGQLGIGPLLAS